MFENVEEGEQEKERRTFFFSDDAKRLKTNQCIDLFSTILIVMMIFCFLCSFFYFIVFLDDTLVIIR